MVIVIVLVMLKVTLFRCNLIVFVLKFFSRKAYCDVLLMQIQRE